MRCLILGFVAGVACLQTRAALPSATRDGRLQPAGRADATACGKPSLSALGRRLARLLLGGAVLAHVALAGRCRQGRRRAGHGVSARRQPTAPLRARRALPARRRTASRARGAAYRRAWRCLVGGWRRREAVGVQPGERWQLDGAAAAPARQRQPGGSDARPGCWSRAARHRLRARRRGAGQREPPAGRLRARLHRWVIKRCRGLGCASACERLAARPALCRRHHCAGDRRPARHRGRPTGRSSRAPASAIWCRSPACTSP